MRSIILKSTSLILSVVLCLGILAGCGDRKETETEALTAPDCTTTPIVDEPVASDVLNDAITLAISDHVNDSYKDVDGYFKCESHSIIASTYADGTDSFDALVYRDETVFFNPMTGDNAPYPENTHVCVISFVKDGNGYKADKFDEYASLDKIEGDIFSDVTEMPASPEMTPYRYVKDGEIYEFDEDRYVQYIENLISQVLTLDTIHESYKVYVRENKDIYNKLFDAYGIGDFVIGEFLKGNVSGARGYVMYRVLEDILEQHDEQVDKKLSDQNNAQEYFDAVLEVVINMLAKDGYMVNATSLPTLCKIAEMYLESLSNDKLYDTLLLYVCPNSLVVHKDGKSVTYTKEDDKYFELIRLNIPTYTPNEYLTFKETANDPDKICEKYYKKGDITTDSYIEYVYEGKDDTNHRCYFVGSGKIVLIPSESAEGKYDVFEGYFGNEMLTEAIDACFE